VTEDPQKAAGLRPALQIGNNYSLWLNFPATMVATAAPLKVRASKGELRDLLGEDFTL
jgi:hypothetical protein